MYIVFLKLYLNKFLTFIREKKSNIELILNLSHNVTFFCESTCKTLADPGFHCDNANEAHIDWLWGAGMRVAPVHAHM